MVVEATGGAHEFQLGRFLDAPQLLHHPGRGDEVEVLAQGLVVEDVDRARVEAQGTHAPAAQDSGHFGVLARAVDEGVLHGPQALGRLGEAGVGHEQVAAAGQHHEPAHCLVALRVEQLEAGQIVAVGGERDEKRGKSPRGHERAQALAPGGEYGRIVQLHL